MSERNPASAALIRAALAGKVDPDYAKVLADTHAGRVVFTETDVDATHFDALIGELVDATPEKFREEQAQKPEAYDPAEDGRQMGVRQKAEHADRSPGGLAFR